jgi:beta-glucan synthesis-associated protein KRE6
MNGYTGGPYQQAVSGTTLLNKQWYNGTQYQKYAFEYVPGTSTGKIAWFVGEAPSFIMDGRASGPNGNVAAREISQELMSMVLNLGISGAWDEIRREPISSFPSSRSLSIWSNARDLLPAFSPLPFPQRKCY